MFSVDDLNDDSKTPWPEESEIRSEDIDKWGWGDDDGTGVSIEEPASEDTPVSSMPARASHRKMPRPGRSRGDRAKEARAPRLSHLAEQTLQQVDQRNADLAALMTRLKLQELRQQQGQFSQQAAYQDSFAHPHAAGICASQCTGTWLLYSCFNGPLMLLQHTASILIVALVNSCNKCILEPEHA